jgi:subtilase family serine protease
MTEAPKKLIKATLIAAAALLISLPAGLRAQSAVAPRVTAKIDDAQRTRLTGHVRPFLSATTDEGPVADSQRTGPIMLMLSRTPAQQADLDAFVDQLHNKQSASFHKWLTPAQFGARFQPADSDVAAVKAWLVSKGFTVLDIVPSKTFISFTGTVGQLRAAFHVDIHHVAINGEKHMATINEPEVPTALASVVGGLHKLDDFSPKPTMTNVGLFKRDAKTGKSTRLPSSTTLPTANFDGGTGDYLVGPQDFYTIYNENPLLTSGITGTGQTIALIEEVQVNPTDVTTFRSLFGLPAYPSTPNSTLGGVNYLYGNSTTGLNGYASCYAPATTAAGLTSGEESEADLDLQWSGTVAPNAIIDFVACGGTATSPDGNTLGSLGIDHSAQYIANYLYKTVTAASMSYGECEADMSSSATTGVGYYNGQWEQFAAEGITAIISTGDGGAEQCYQNGRYASTLPPSVNGFGSSAYNVGAGGTDLGDAYESANYTTIPVSTWWSSTNGPGESSALSYVPETTWGGYCSNPLFASYLQSLSSTVFGTVYTPEAICNNSTANSDGYRAIVGGNGGISTFNTIPTWQNVYGVGLNSVSTTYRNLPDVSLFAANGFWGHYLPYCESDADACTVAEYDTGVLGAGGTSFVAPQLAGFMALVNQKTGSAQGQADYTFYNLAALEYGTPGSPASTLTSCSGSAVAAGKAPPSSCYLYDISNDMPSLQGGTIAGGIYQPCRATGVDCYAGNGGGTYGVNTVPGTTASAGILGYTTSPGYDDATGLGSLNITAIVNGWNNVTPTFTSTSTIASSAATVTPTTSVTLTSTVTATGRGGSVAPSGYVQFYTGTSTASNILLGTQPVTPVCTGTGSSTSCVGSASLTVSGSSFPVGSESVVAYFEGDGANDAPALSPTTTVKVYGYPVGNLDNAEGAKTLTSTVPQSDTLYVSGWAADPVDGSPLSNVVVYVDGVSIGTPTLGISRPDVVSATGNSTYANSGFVLTYSAASLSLGSHTVTVKATNSGGVTTTFPGKTITVVAAYKAPVGNLDMAVDNVTATTPVHSSHILYTQGWAADYQANGPVASVTIVIDGHAVGNATLGQSRPDVAAYYADPGWASTGWVYTMNASSLSVGSHTITAYAIDHTGLVTYFETINFSVVTP